MSSLPSSISQLRTWVASRQKLVVLTGAGISTDSGIPDYRSPGRPPHTPIQHSAFMSSEASRRRYWARSMIGYLHLSQAKPNIGHQVLAKAEHAGHVHHIITQNVDGLHHKAGSHHVTMLHGDIHHVRCMSCNDVTTRKHMQIRLESLNPYLLPYISPTPALTSTPTPSIRPDGDMIIQDSLYNDLVIPSCEKCNGILKPDVIFFGGIVPSEVTKKCDALIAESDGLLVLGTSLAVWSSYRLVRNALYFHPSRPNSSTPPPPSPAARVPVPTPTSVPPSSSHVAILTSGWTRADHEVSLKIDARINDILPYIFDIKETNEPLKHTMEL